LDYDDLIIEYPELKMQINEMIYEDLTINEQFLKEFNDLSNKFQNGNVVQYYIVVKRLCVFFKKVAATRPYYVCEKICEIYEEQPKCQKGGINIDLDCYNEAWSMYPTLIEYTI
jgi:hypothetical protein